MKRIELDYFDNRLAFEMGSRVIELAKKTVNISQLR